MHFFYNVSVYFFFFPFGTFLPTNPPSFDSECMWWHSIRLKWVLNSKTSMDRQIFTVSTSMIFFPTNNSLHALSARWTSGSSGIVNAWAGEDCKVRCFIWSVGNEWKSPICCAMMKYFQAIQYILLKAGKKSYFSIGDLQIYQL